MSKQTAVELYEKEINYLLEKYEAKLISKRKFITMKHNVFYNAKEIEKDNIIDSYINGRYESDRIVFTQRFYAEQYYNETFKKINNE